MWMILWFYDFLIGIQLPFFFPCPACYSFRFALPCFALPCFALRWFCVMPLPNLGEESKSRKKRIKKKKNSELIGGEGVGRGGEKKGNLATRTEFRKNWRRTVRYGLRVLTWRDLSGACESGLKKRKKKKKKKKKRKKKNRRSPSNVWMCTLGKYQLGPKRTFVLPSRTYLA